MKSGGYLIIEHTEAMTVIDVNTGKADFKSNRDKTIQKINEEAAKEISDSCKLEIYQEQLLLILLVQMN